MRIKSLFWKNLLLLFLLIGCGVRSTIADPNNDYSNGVIPTPPCSFPERFKNYQILPASISPNKQYALIYPKRSVLYDLKEYSLYLVSLNPFRILTIIPLRWSNLAENAHGWYGVNWSKDSSAVIMIEGSKWGPDKVYLTTVRGGYAGSITDLTEEVISEVKDDFIQSKAVRFNNFHEFIFDGDSTGWDFINNNQVKIRYECTNDPKDLKEKNLWRVRFEGVWDISKAEFMTKKISPLKRAPL
jgi:hypothetical protein